MAPFSFTPPTTVGKFTCQDGSTVDWSSVLDQGYQCNDGSDEKLYYVKTQLPAVSTTTSPDPGEEHREFERKLEKDLAKTIGKLEEKYEDSDTDWRPAKKTSSSLKKTMDQVLGAMNKILAEKDDNKQGPAGGGGVTDMLARTLAYIAFGGICLIGMQLRRNNFYLNFSCNDSLNFMSNFLVALILLITGILFIFPHDGGCWYFWYLNILFLTFNRFN